MTIKTFTIIFTLALFITFGCGKKSGDTSKTDTKENTTTPTETKINEDSLKKVQDADKQQKIKDALAEDKLVTDTLGQWAVSAEASSSYGDETNKDKTPYTATQMTGKPDVENYADDGRAWAEKEADKGMEWVKLTYEKPVNATEVRVRQNVGPGAIIKVELIDTDGKSHTVWEGEDKTQYIPEKIQYFIAKFDKTTYKTKVVKITMACNAVQGWNEIDAVQLVGDNTTTTTTTSTPTTPKK